MDEYFTKTKSKATIKKVKQHMCTALKEWFRATDTNTSCAEQKLNMLQ